MSLIRLQACWDAEAAVIAGIEQTVRWYCELEDLVESFPASGGPPTRTGSDRARSIVIEIRDRVHQMGDHGKVDGGVVQFMDDTLAEIMSCLTKESDLGGPRSPRAKSLFDRDTRMRESANCIREMKYSIEVLRRDVDEASRILESGMAGKDEGDTGKKDASGGAAGPETQSPEIFRDAACLDCISENLPVLESFVALLSDVCREKSHEELEAMAAVARVLHCPWIE